MVYSIFSCNVNYFAYSEVVLRMFRISVFLGFESIDKALALLYLFYRSGRSMQLGWGKSPSERDKLLCRGKPSLFLFIVQHVKRCFFS